jgi:hypothetical protein
MDALPMAPSCALDEADLRSQYERYRRAGAGAMVVHRSPRRLVVILAYHIDMDLIEETIAIERGCCPFYELGWDPDLRRLSVVVSRPEHEPALEAIAFALGLGTPQST